MGRNLITQFNYFDTMARAQKGYARLLEPICKKWDLTRNELDVMLFLANNPALDRAADIVTHRGLVKSHVSLSVSTLESKGFLYRQADPEDRRTVHLKLMPEAFLIAQAGREAQKAFLDKIHQGISQEELEIWRGMTQKIKANIKATEE